MESANKMELTYTNVNGYLIPNLTYKSGEQMEQLGKYGFLRRDGIDSVRSAIKELEHHGYVERHRFSYIKKRSLTYVTNIVIILNI